MIQKYVISGGLAFSEDKDLEKLRKYSLKGWHVNGFKFMGYTLEKGKSKDYIYTIDYRTLKKEETEEYFELFSSSGWTHISSQANIHLFRGLPGTSPIFSDRETEAEKHEHLGYSIKWFVIFLALGTILLWVGTSITKGHLQTMFEILAMVCTVVAIPATWTGFAINNNKWKAEGKKGLVKLTSCLPIVLVAFSIFLLFRIVEDSNNIFRLIAYLFIGAILIPIVVQIFIPIYSELSKVFNFKR
ncbi:DUF2812 domain-containing protein [Rummeliibacillus sp. TYF-LIM-RU47]|uniref:DUF2812 domain-containing protein n=1 Tax=Rummeliibacillus sp. TYF-LIM-RU47 TaxID=2608406 RepID=UPI00123AC0F9|nr:DUF2812 domain-containing protein [Rummeliibacillus sp. TYF-LIM-RU47]